MKLYTKYVSVLIIGLFLGSTMLSLAIDSNPEKTENLEEISVVSEVASPGHNVFLQYISSDNCYYCYHAGGGSESAHNLKVSNPDEFVYITYSSLNYGATNDARSGNVAPIYAMNHLGQSGGAPTGHMGDSDPEISGSTGDGKRYDSSFSSGGNMPSSVMSDYQISVMQNVNPSNSANVDITMEASYVGSGTAPSSTVLYAAVTEEKCAYTYGDGTYAHNCWQAWLLNGNSYATKSGTVGGGTGFVTMDLNSGTHTETWTVPASLARSRGGQSGIDNMLSIGAIFSDWSTSSHNEDVYAVSDSTMGPKMDLAVTDVTVTNPSAPNGYVNGDMVTVSATAKNIGGLDYVDGGTLEIVYLNSGNPIVVDSKSFSSLNILATTTHSAVIDTTSLPANAWETGFGARISGLTGDGLSGNNLLVEDLAHDRPPVAKQATVSGDNVIERGSIFTVVARGSADDLIDTIDTMTFELEVSPSGLNLWDGSIDSGGETIVNLGTSNEGREYTMAPIISMPSGFYDLRSRTVDSRSQVSDWKITANAFELANGIPQVTAEPVPTVTCDVPTEIDMTNHIFDPETLLQDLIIDSDNSYFVSWNSQSSTITVNFAYDEVQGCPLGQKSILVTVDDGGDYSSNGALPYGTLKFNVIENGQPRWLGLPTQTIDEEGPDSDGSLRLIPYVSDTTSDGQDSSSELLTYSVIDQTNSELISATIINGVLGYEVIGTDANGQSTLTIRACDTDLECSDQTILIKIDPVNDPPVVDVSELTSLSLKAGTEMSIDLESLVSDVDNEANEVTILVSSPDEPGGAQFIRSSGILKLKFDEIGNKDIVISVIDTYDSSEYTITIDVFDELDFTVAKNPSDDGFMVVEASNMYVGMIPTVDFYLNDDAPTFTSITVNWQTCSQEGICDGYWSYDLDMTKSTQGWQTEMNIPYVGDPTGTELARPFGYAEGDYFFLMVDAVDSLNNNYKVPIAAEPLYKWVVTESLPLPSQMDDGTLETHIDSLNQKIESITQQIAEETGDTTELEQQLANIETDLEFACLDPRIECSEDGTSGTSSDDAESDSNMLLIGGIIAAVIIASLLGGLFLMRGDRTDEQVGFKWADTTLPARDVVANSMYGGSQAIFQQTLPNQQYAQPQTAPVHPAPPQLIPLPQAHRGPPLPPSGLPAGWTMDQWEYYGQQYLDRLQN